MWTRVPSGTAAGNDLIAQASRSLHALRVADRESGERVPDPLRQQIERATSRDLSHVRVHATPVSAAAAAAIDADAYARGDDLHFAAGQYRPGTPAGDRLIVHETIHALQQPGRAATPTARELSSPGDHAEIEANAATDAVLSGRSIAVARVALPGVIHRQPAGASAEAKKKYATPEEEIMANLLAYERAAADPGAAEAALAELRATLGRIPVSLIERVQERIGKEKSTDTLAVVFRRALSPSRQSELLALLDQRLHPEKAPAPEPKPKERQPEMPVERWVDNFDETRTAYDDTYIPAGKDPKKPSRWLKVIYEDGTQIDIDLESMEDHGAARENFENFRDAYVGAGKRIFPKKMNQHTTPRLWAWHEHYLKVTGKVTAIIGLTGVQLGLSPPAFPAGNPALGGLPRTPPSRLATRATPPAPPTPQPGPKLVKPPAPGVAVPVAKPTNVTPLRPSGGGTQGATGFDRGTSPPKLELAQPQPQPGLKLVVNNPNPVRAPAPAANPPTRLLGPAPSPPAQAPATPSLAPGAAGGLGAAAIAEGGPARAEAEPDAAVAAKQKAQTPAPGAAAAPQTQAQEAKEEREGEKEEKCPPGQARYNQAVAVARVLQLMMQAPRRIGEAGRATSWESARFWAIKKSNAAVISIVTPKECMLATAEGTHDLGGVEHAEEVALKQLQAWRNVNRLFPRGTRLSVVVASPPCGAGSRNCSARLMAFAHAEKPMLLFNPASPRYVLPLGGYREHIRAGD